MDETEAMKPPTFTSPFTLHRGAGEETHIVVGGNRATADEIFARWAKEGLRAGGTICYPDGTRIWERIQAIRVDGECVWHEDGNRVRAQRCEYTRHADGTITSRQTGRKIWVLWERVH